MALPAIGFGLDKGRSLPRPRPRNRCEHSLPDRQDIVSVYGLSGHAVPGCSEGEIRDVRGLA